MLFSHPEHPGRAVRLAYCLNLHPAPTLEGMLAGLRTITLPLRERLSPGKEFGVGMYAPASLAAHLTSQGGERDRERLGSFLREHGLDPFTWNAFPSERFGASGLKEHVFEPGWADPGRLEFTRDVALLARLLAAGPSDGRHLSISTHTGWHSSRPGDPRAAAANLVTAAALLERGSSWPGWRVILALEAEPRANCNDTTDLPGWLQALRAASLRSLPVHDLGACLDTCHASVEFEDASQAVLNATAQAAPLGKLQFTSALALRARRREDLAPLLAMDEPRYLHQVTARTRAGVLRVGDLPELSRALDRPGGEVFWEDSELRCHFHVPVDLAELGGTALGTTRDHADAMLAAALARPDRWGTVELHVEIETYTWDVLPRGARGPGELVDGLEREYRHVIARLEAAGWRPA